ncbi:exo-beta-N-acetylmuramidase NamZ domain-containing protein [Spirosoma sp.]|uniref:exo-beta-N-acetylmuramidase NamZ family protein n=1 Tax=Spirosoma sp. TaxID=1899569 RepID=UPI003B3BD1D4
MKAHSLTLFSLLLSLLCLGYCFTSVRPLRDTGSTKTARITDKANPQLITGADQVAAYLPYLKGKRIGLVVNQTSIIGNKPSVDSLVSLGVNIVRIFGPEHGFRGNASNGTKVDDSVDAKTGIPVISLYGKNRKPSKEQLADVDLMVFDIQDVGCRFYTYINTLNYVMEACAEHRKELMILDRPNPNGFIVDGPILEDHLHSGIGIHPIPITHGCTLGEFAQMINGEGWNLPGKNLCKLKIIKVANYAHDMPYTLPVMPSPNLNTQQSIMLYPSICWFEGTIISQGRGTYMPFTVLGAPELKGKYSFSFRPVSIKGMSETPLYQDTECYGLDLRKYDVNLLRKSKKLNLQWLIELYKAYPNKARFFDNTISNQIGKFDFRSGNETLRKQIIAGTSEKEIRQSWEPGLAKYKQMRKKYLLYP